MPSAPAEPSELRSFARFCEQGLTLDNGRPFVLEPFQRRILSDFFAGTTQTLVIIPKKNGKTTLVAALGLYHLLTTPNADAYIAASSREQASIVLRQARKFIRDSVLLRQRVRMKQREVVSLDDESLLRVVASDVDTADGAIPTLAIIDELHRHKSTDLLGVFRDGLKPRNGRMVTITTAGGDSDSALGRMRMQAYTMPTVRREGAYRYARSRNGKWTMHEWALDDHQDREDMAVVKTANPASWQDEEALRQRFDDPSTTPWQWARFACGVWLQGENTAINPVEWAECATDEDPPAGLQWRLGTDLGWKDDTTALVAHALDDEGVAWFGVPRVLRAERDGASLRKRTVIDALCELRDEYDTGVVVIDPENDGEVLAQDLEDLGFDVVAHSQKPAPMALAAERFSAAVRERKLRHPRDDTFTRHVLNGHVKTTDDGRWRFVKETKQSSKHIDALIAAAMVHSVAVGEANADDAPFVFEVIA